MPRHHISENLHLQLSHFELEYNLACCTGISNAHTASQIVEGPRRKLDRQLWPWPVPRHYTTRTVHLQLSACFTCRVSGFGFRVSGFGFQVSGFGFRVSGFGFRVSGFGFRISDFGFRGSGFRSRVSVLGLRFSVLGFRVQGFNNREAGSAGSGFSKERSEPETRNVKQADNWRWEVLLM